MSWLVTGGAGYIGAHVVRALIDENMRPVVLDDLSSGHERFVPREVPFVRTTLLDIDEVRRTITQHDVEGVIHVAGFKFPGQSVDRPLHTFEQNVVASAVLLRAMTDCGVDKIVFSSSCSTYGTPAVEHVTETTPTHPQSPYGESKLVVDWLLDDMIAAGALRGTSLRYFNVVGSGNPDLPDTSPHNLFPKVFEALAMGQSPAIYGTDYPTPDGTCIRDYIHVVDLAQAHVFAAQALAAGTTLRPIYNLGSGAGTSVREIMDTIRSVTGIDFEIDLLDRRPGDPARIVANCDLAARDLGWRARHDLTQMVSSAWRARSSAASF